MLALNLTVLVEAALFLLFLWVTNRIVYRPLLAVTDKREGRVTQDRANAEADAKRAQEAESQFRARLEAAHQTAAQRVRQARYDAYHEHRVRLDELRNQVDQEVAVYRQMVDNQVDAERHRYPAFLPGLIQAMDQQLSVEGRLL